MQFMQQVKERLRVGMQVHVDADVEGEGRVCGDGVIVRAPRSKYVNIRLFAMRGGAGCQLSILRADVTPLNTRFYICKGDPEVDCLTWYVTENRHGKRIEGYDDNPLPNTPHPDSGLFEPTFGPAMSMTLEAAVESEYLPKPVRDTALMFILAAQEAKQNNQQPI